MRIIRGEFKNRKISPPKNFKSRPTTDFAKEALFNILENRLLIPEVSALDLFCGTGSISLEFLSRGCKNITGVEQNYSYSKHLKTHFSTFSLDPKHFKIITCDAFAFAAKKDLSDFNLIFADPPFRHPKLAQLPDLLFANPSLPPETLIIIEHPRNIDFSSHSSFERKTTYSAVNFSFFKN